MHNDNYSKERWSRWATLGVPAGDQHRVVMRKCCWTHPLQVFCCWKLLDDTWPLLQRCLTVGCACTHCAMSHCSPSEEWLFAHHQVRWACCTGVSLQEFLRVIQHYPLTSLQAQKHVSEAVFLELHSTILILCCSLTCSWGLLAELLTWPCCWSSSQPCSACRKSLSQCSA